MLKYVCCLLLTLVNGIVAAQDTTRLSVMFIGDIMQHDSQIQAAFDPKTRKYVYDTCFRFIRKYFRSADLTIGNLELTLAGKPYTGYPQFSAPDELAVALKRAGVDVLVTANNHSLDRRRKGLERTISVLDSLGIMHTGTFRDTVERLNDYPLVLQRNGVSIALLNYTYGTNGIPVTKPNVVNLIDTALIGRDLQKARQLRPDVVVVFMHWGNEYQSQPSTAQKQLAEFCLQKGASVVVGAHPHVLQPMHWYKEQNRVVAYSLGNFISGQRDHPRDGAASLMLEIIKIYQQDSVYVQIADAKYLLHWVYRTPLPDRRFLVLPVPDFENDTTGFIADDASRLAFQKFIFASRKLLTSGKNLLTEIDQPCPDSVPKYRVVFRVQNNKGIHHDEIMLQYNRFGLHHHYLNGHTIVYQTGTIRTHRQAAAFAERLRNQFSDVEIITSY